MPKRSKFKFKYLIRAISTLLILIVAILAIVPVIYKDDIIKLIKDQSNENLNAELNFEKIDLSLLSTFPSMTLEINNLTISGKDTFENLKLVELNQLTLNLDLWKIVFDGDYEVKSILLIEPKIHIKVFSDGLANYDIYNSLDTVPKNSSEKIESSPLEFKISNYEIRNATIVYDDALYITKLQLNELNHIGSFTMIGDKYRLETATNASSFDLRYDGINYFEKSKIDIVFNGEVEFIKQDIKLVITESLFNINQFKINTKGEFIMREQDYLMDLSVSTLDQSFKSLFSVVPGVYKQEFNSIKTNGDFKFNGNINGVYSDSLMPKIEMELLVNNGYFKYPELSDPVDNINIELNVDFPGGNNLDLLKFKLDNFSLEFLNSTFSSQLHATKLISDPYLNSTVSAELDLMDVSKVIPINGQEVSGMVSSNIKIDGNLSTLEEKRYDEFDASGQLNILKLKYNSLDLAYDINLKKLAFEFYPHKLLLKELSLLVGNSDFSMNGELTNYIPFALKDDTLEGSFNMISSLVDIDQLYVDSSSEMTDNVSTDSTMDFDAINEVFEIPENIYFTFSSSINKLIYDSLILRNSNGIMTVKNGLLNFNNIRMNFFDGSFEMNGNYKSISKKQARMTMDMEVLDISFDEAYLYFNSVKKYAPVVEYLEGDFSSTLNMDLILDENYLPVYSQVSVDGTLKSKNIKLLDHPALRKLDKLNEPILKKNNKIENLNLSFHLKNGKYSIDKTPLRFKDFEATIYGSTSISQEIDYTIESEIPISLINNNLATGLRDLMPRGGPKNNNVPLSIKIKGTALLPTYQTNIKLNKMELKENLILTVKETVEDLQNEALEKAQIKADQIIELAKNKADLLRKESEIIAVKIIDESKKQNRNAKVAINKQLSKLKKDAIDQSKIIESKANSPISKIAAKKTAEKIIKSADNEAEKLEIRLTKVADLELQNAIEKANKVKSEGNNKADLLLEKANQEADVLIQSAKNK